MKPIYTSLFVIMSLILSIVIIIFIVKSALPITHKIDSIKKNIKMMNNYESNVQCIEGYKYIIVNNTYGIAIEPTNIECDE